MRFDEQLEEVGGSSVVPVRMPLGHTPAVRPVDFGLVRGAIDPEQGVVVRKFGLGGHDSFPGGLVHRTVPH